MGGLPLPLRDQHHQPHAPVDPVSLLHRYPLYRAISRRLYDLLGLHGLDGHQVLAGFHNVVRGDVDRDHDSRNRTYDVVAGGLARSPGADGRGWGTEYVGLAGDPDVDLLSVAVGQERHTAAIV